MIRVRVPATSANLGVGYDCLGMALTLYGTFTFDFSQKGIVVSGCPKEYQNADNLVLQAFFSALRAWGLPLPEGVALQIDTEIPVARGLGSSASCIAAGVLAAHAYGRGSETIDAQEVLRQCLQLEAHPDNLAPAITGGLCASFLSQSADDDLPRPFVATYPIQERYRFVTVIPDYEVHTQKARTLLPKTMRYADAVYQMGRCAAICKGLENGDEDLVRHACTDRMQEPYRKQLIPEYDAVRSLAFANGAAAFYISGSGPTMIAIVDRSRSEALCAQLAAAYPSWQVHCLSAAEQGGVVEDE